MFSLCFSRLVLNWSSEVELWCLREATKEGKHDQMTDRVNGSIDKHWSRGATLFAQKQMEKAVETSYRLKSCSGPPGTHWFYLWERGGLSWHSSPITDSQRNPSAKTLNAPIHLSDMCAEMCSEFNSSINQWLSSTDEWVFGCHGQAAGFQQRCSSMKLQHSFVSRENAWLNTVLFRCVMLGCSFNRSVCRSKRWKSTQQVWKKST